MRSEFFEVYNDFKESQKHCEDSSLPGAASQIAMAINAMEKCAIATGVFMSDFPDIKASYIESLISERYGFLNDDSRSKIAEYRAGIGICVKLKYKWSPRLLSLSCISLLRPGQQAAANFAMQQLLELLQSKAIEPEKVADMLRNMFEGKEAK